MGHQRKNLVSELMKSCKLLCIKTTTNIHRLESHLKIKKKLHQAKIKSLQNKSFLFNDLTSENRI